MPVNDNSFEHLVRSAQAVAFGGEQAWPATGEWVEDLDEVMTHTTEELAEEGIGLHLELASKLTAIRAKFLENNYSLEDWLNEVRHYYLTFDAETAEEVQRGAKLLYAVLDDK